jgi:hypothetical protein
MKKGRAKLSIDRLEDSGQVAKQSVDQERPYDLSVEQDLDMKDTAEWLSTESDIREAREGP